MALQKVFPAGILQGFNQLKWSGNSTTPYQEYGSQVHFARDGG